MTQRYKIPDRLELWGLFKKLNDIRTERFFNHLLTTNGSPEAAQDGICQMIILLRQQLGIDPNTQFWAQLPHEREVLPQPVQYIDTEGKAYQHIPDFARQATLDLPDSHDPA